MTSAKKPNPDAVLKQIAQIQKMERGSISVMRKTPGGELFNHQTWEHGKNHARYVPRDEVAPLKEAIEGYQRFKQLSEEYAQLIIDKTRAERAAEIKKRRLLTSSPSRTPKSSR